MSNLIKKFKENKFIVVRLAVSAEFTDLITQYALFDEIQDFRPDIDHVIGAHSKYADPLMEAMLLILQHKVEETTGLKLLPTYSYFRVYRPGDELTSHQDRPACEISTTVCFNFWYNDPSYSWPIFMDGTPIDLQPGDMAIYRGIDVEHWREKFTAPDDAWQVQGFFHYVDANGPHTEWKYDKRDNIGDHMAVPKGQQVSDEVAMQRHQMAKNLGFRPDQGQPPMVARQDVSTPAPVAPTTNSGLKSYISFTS